MKQETWLNSVYKNMASLIPESKDVFLNKLKNKINFNYDKITETTLRNDRSYILTESQINEYRWILNPNSWEVNNYSKFLDSLAHCFHPKPIHWQKSRATAASF